MILIPILSRLNFVQESQNYIYKKKRADFIRRSLFSIGHGKGNTSLLLAIE